MHITFVRLSSSSRSTAGRHLSDAQNSKQHPQHQTKFQAAPHPTIFNDLRAPWHSGTMRACQKSPLPKERAVPWQALQ